MMSNGLNVSQRDETGVTLRDVARLARRKDILELIDKAYIKTIRMSDLEELRRLCIMGYDGMFINFNHRDTFIFASGNETEDALNFLQKLPEIQSQIRQLHRGIHQWSRDKIVKFLTSSKWSDILINARDKGGRTVLHLAILHWRMDLLKLFLSWDNIEINAVTNVGRSAYHYACCVEEETERDQFCRMLKETGQDVAFPDYKGLLPEQLIGKEESTQWIQRERKMRYGMVKQLQCVDKYEELCHMMKCKGKTLVHFEKSLCRFQYPVAEFHKILSPLMPEYRDLILVAMDKKKEDIATRLIQLGTDWTLLDWVNADGEVSRKNNNESCKQVKRKHYEAKSDIKAVITEDQLNPNTMTKKGYQEISTSGEENKENHKENEDEMHIKYSYTVPCQGDMGSANQDEVSKVSKGMECQEEKTELELVTVEERAHRLGMLEVLLAIEKKKAFQEKKQTECLKTSKYDDSINDSRSSANEIKESRGDDSPKSECLKNVLIPIRKLPESLNSSEFHIEKSRDHTEVAAQTLNNDVHFTVESLEYDSDSFDEYDDKGENDSTIDQNEAENDDNNYEDDQFYSDDNSISDFDDYND
ncbi:hypothetical protein EGW08_007039 [Elysia chlorotica]|uniref:Uncharacterized protein n=1 Tax=Elysia chlorotica TaxID=188477 RepID=A0A3S1A8C8_ELYCH|nr:hypothetical protein EGW08_007039 [Elysia chlorotica]